MDRLPTPVFLGFPCGSAGKESACNVGDLGSVPGLGRSPGEGKGCPLQYPSLENSMDCIVHGVAKSRTWLSEFHFHFQVDLLVRLTHVHQGKLVKVWGTFFDNSELLTSALKSISVKWMDWYSFDWYLMNKCYVCVLHHSDCRGYSETRSVVSDSLRPHGLFSSWNSFL